MKSYIYKLTCSESKKVYIGSTKNLKKRYREHICIINGGKGGSRCSSKILINPILDILEEFDNISKEDLFKRETEYIKNNDCINKKNAFTSLQERKEYLKKYMKEWEKNNKEKRKIIDSKRNEKINCSCGSIVSKRNIAQHKKSKKHLNYEKSNL